MPDDFARQRDWWNAKAGKEEADLADEAINRRLRWREIERHLDGVETILDVGGATGAFSIPLARRGFVVTHLDISPAMLDVARSRAEGLSNISFVEGNAIDLSRYEDRSFDLVLNTDGAVSFCGPAAERALREACRLTRRTLIATVSNRADLAAWLVQDSVRLLGRLGTVARAMLERGEWSPDADPESALFVRGATQDYLPPMRAFTASEMRALLVRNGMRPVRVGGLGSLANLCGIETVRRCLEDDALLEPFVEACERFDLDVLPDGPGTWQRAGLIAVAKPEVLE